jgi:hypothetical protein
MAMVSSADIASNVSAVRTYGRSASLRIAAKLGVIGAWMLLASLGGGAHAQCTTPPGATGTVVRVEQRQARATVEVTRPNSAGRKAEIEYNDEVFTTRFDPQGKARISFVLTAPDNEIAVRLTESATITCKVDVPDFQKLYRITLQWRDMVKLDLDVVEPGRRPGGFGHVNRSRPNADLTQGLGQLDVVTDAVDDGATAQVSYVVADAAAIPAGSVMGLRLDYLNRGAKPEPPYCGDHPKATVAFEVITIDRGQVRRGSFGVGRARCGETLADNARLMRIRQ